MKFRTASLRTLGLLLALACGLPVVSQEPPHPAAPAYNIELVIFRATSAQGGAENWAAEAGSANIADDEGSTGSASQVGHFVAAIPSSAYQLTEIEGRLRSSGAYVPVAHVAWSQTASGWGTRAGFPLQRLGAGGAGVGGAA